MYTLVYIISVTLSTFGLSKCHLYRFSLLEDFISTKQLREYSLKLGTIQSLKTVCGGTSNQITGVHLYDKTIVCLWVCCFYVFNGFRYLKNYNRLEREGELSGCCREFVFTCVACVCLCFFVFACVCSSVSRISMRIIPVSVRNF